VTLFQQAAEEVKAAMAAEIYPAFTQSKEYAELVENSLI